MAASDHAKPISRRSDALAIVRRLVDAGYVAYFAGGCVRDALLGLEPKDYDVVTSATPDEIRRRFPRSQGVGQAFGVHLVREGRSVIELTTFRADGPYTDGRRPDDVRLATPEEDARRRDFTINGLFHDPIADRVIDHVGGVADLEAGMLRAIGDPAKRFSEDYLRLLRAARFAARFDLSIDTATSVAIRANADRLPRIAPERLCDELRAMLAPATRIRAKALLDELGLTPILLRQPLAASQTMPASLPTTTRPAFFVETCADTPTSFPLALAALVVGELLARGESIASILTDARAAELGRQLRATLRITNEELASLRGILDAGKLLSADVPGVAALKRYLATPDAADGRRLLRGLAALDIRADAIAVLEARFASFPHDAIAPTPFVTGDDLVQAGHAPCPRFKPALDAAYDAQLEDRATDQATALAVAEQVLTERT